MAHCSSKDTELKCRVRSESSGDDLPGTERSTHLQLQTSEIFSYSLCLCRGEIGRLLNPMSFPLVWLILLYLKQTARTCCGWPRAHNRGRSAAQGSAFHPPPGRPSEEGEGKRRRNGLQCPRKHLVTLSSSGHFFTPPYFTQTLCTQPHPLPLLKSWY